MTATDELRRMLDERGVEWDELQDCEGGKMTRWRDSMGRYVTACDDGVVTFNIAREVALEFMDALMPCDSKARRDPVGAILDHSAIIGMEVDG